MPEYVVQQGDYLGSIAKRFGISDYRAIWNHPENAALRQRRGNPNVLFPGDRVFVPERDARSEDAASDQRHRFSLAAPRLKLRLELRDAYGQALADRDGQLEVEGVTQAVRTDAQGRLEAPLPAGAQLARLRVGERSWELHIGELDPVTEASGWRQRLGNLGYPAGSSDDADDPALKRAVEEFQCDQGLAVDGICGPLTQARLVKVHGA